jgi:hypothetical protein
MRLRQKAKIDLIEFVRPSGYWPQPYSIEMAVSVLQKMIETGEGFFEKHTWNTTSVGSLLGGANADNVYPNPITSLDDLRARFHRALLSDEKRAPEIKRWREQSGFSIGSTIEIKFPHHKPFSNSFPHPLRCEDDIQKMLNELLECPDGLRLEEQLNSVHNGARMVHDVVLFVGRSWRCTTSESDGRFSFVLRYGFESKAGMKEKGDSQWNHVLAYSRSGEPFLQTLVRARTEFDRCLNGETEQSTERNIPRERCC